MKANKIAMLGIAALLGSTVYANVRVIKAENNQLEEGLDAIEDAIPCLDYEYRIAPE